MDEMTFVSWRRSSLAEAATVEAGHLRTTVVPTLEDTAVGVVHRGQLHAVLRSAGDVAGFSPLAVRHRVPTPHSHDAEETKWAHIDFRSPDFPWRYSPVPSAGERLKPWVVLLVARADELDLDGRALAISAKTSLLLGHPAHDLGASAAFAHVQTPAGDPANAATPSAQRFSRLLNLRDLEPMTSYTALVVPAFNAQGTAMWTAGGTVDNAGKPIPVFDSWPFTTGEAGDFESLATALHIVDDDRIGLATVRFRMGADDIVTLETRGALASLHAVQDADMGRLDEVAERLQVLVDLSFQPGEPEPLGLPHYGVPWVDGTPPAEGWEQELRDDPRRRIHAGTGVRMGVAAQEDLMRAAIEQAGALSEAAARIGQLAAGLHLAGLQWQRALPADPVERLRALGPLTTRLAVDGTAATLADAVTADDTNFDCALFTSAGQRLLGRPARVRGPKRPDAASLLRRINKGMPAVPPPPGSEAELAAKTVEQLQDQWMDAGLREQVRLFLEEALDAARLACREYRRHRDPTVLDDLAVDLSERVVAMRQDLVREDRCGLQMWRYVSEATGCVFDEERPALALARRMIVDGCPGTMLYGPIQHTLMLCLLGCGPPEPLGEGESECERAVRTLTTPAPPCARPVDLDGLGVAVSQTVDPRGPMPPGRRRLTDRLGDTLATPTLAPPRYPLGLDYPTWSLLRQYDPDWLLPGARQVAKDSITALRTNPAFIDAYLVGLNTQFHAETRWRGMTTDPWGTPLRMFFGPVDAITRDRLRDIIPIGDWTMTSMLGAQQHQLLRPTAENPDAAERLVILLHTPIFRRYPQTLIYLHRGSGTDADLAATPELALDSVDNEEQWYRDRRDIAPAFLGTIGPDLYFFGFDIAPSELQDYWLMLDEPETELRFTAKGRTLPQVLAADASAPLAAESIDPKTRVAISGSALYLERGGEQ